MDVSVNRVAFDWFAASFDDELADLIDREHFWRRCASVMIDEFMTDGAVDIIGSIGKRCLGRANSQHDPVSLDVRNVVQHEAADGHGAEIHQCRWLLDVGKFGVFWMECERDKGLEPTGAVLEVSQSQQVVDAMVRLFDVAVQHGAVGLQANFMGGLVDLNPFVGVRFVLTDLVADFRVENLSAASWHASEANGTQVHQDFFERFFGEEFEPIDFDCGPAFEV